MDVHGGPFGKGGDDLAAILRERSVRASSIAMAKSKSLSDLPAELKVFRTLISVLVLPPRSNILVKGQASNPFRIVCIDGFR